MSILALQWFIQFVFIACQVEGYQNILKLSSKQFAFTSYKAFLKKQKEIWDWFSCLISCMIFEEKHLSFNVLLTEHISLPGYFYFVRYWVMRVLEILC